MCEFLRRTLAACAKAPQNRCITAALWAGICPGKMAGDHVAFAAYGKRKFIALDSII